MQDWHGLIDLVQLSLRIKIMIVDIFKKSSFLDAKPQLTIK